MGVFKIILPKHLDTLFNWTQYSDCGDGCAKVDYCIQSKLLPVFKDNGFYWIPLKDSVEQFGAAGIDKETIDLFNKDLSNNLYKVWNRMASAVIFHQLYALC